MSISMLFKLSVHSMRFRRGAVLITLTAIALSVFSLAAVEHIRQSVKQSFTSTVSGVDLIIGPRTGGIHLLLTTVFRIGQPSQGISWESYQHIANHPKVAWTIPISLGDSHRGFRVVGTQPSLFTRYQYGQKRHLRFKSGNAFTHVNGVVLGASVARKLGYQKGQAIVIAHGLGQTSFQKHNQHPFYVSGILHPTGTPIDNALYVSLEGLELVHQPSHQKMHEQRHKQIHAQNTALGAQLLSDTTQTTRLTPKSLTATMVGLTSKMSTFTVQREINTYAPEALSAILPGVTLSQLWQISRGIERALTWMVGLIMLTSLLGLSAVMLATLRERAYELAVLRTLGARPFTVFCLIQIETLLVTVLGMMVGGALFLATTAILAPSLAIHYGVDIGLGHISATPIYLGGYVLVGALVVGMLPAITGFWRARRL